MALSVSLGESDLAVDPGSFVRTGIRVRNTSSESERLRVRVAGPAAPWSWVVPPELDVAAGAEVVVTVGFRVQRTAEPAAGVLAFEVVAAAAVGHDTENGAREKGVETPEARVAGTLTVTPFRDLAVELDPPDARSTVPTEHYVVVDNRGNVPVTTTLAGSSGDGTMEVAVGSAAVTAAPGGRIRVPVTLRPGKRPLFQPRSRPFAVSAVPDGGEAVTLSGAMEQPARVNGRAAGVVVVAVLVLAAGLRFTVLAPDDAPKTNVAAGDGTTATTTGGSVDDSASGTLGQSAAQGSCAAEGHRDTRATGLTPDDIPSLPPDYAFFQVASDRCAPVRWNPCEPIHYVINPANAPPTGVADVDEAFKRLAAATGLTYVDDGTTDEDSQGNRAYQPDRYGEKWAPILVHWMSGSRVQGDIQVVGGGFPTQVGDVYVSGNLFLNPFVVTNKETRSTVAGGFGSGPNIGAIGPEGVTWGRIILHELAHITGLGHSSDPSNLMYPETSEQTGPAGFSRDDLAGIKLMGKDAGCLDVPAPGSTPDQRIGGARRP